MIIGMLDGAPVEWRDAAVWVADECVSEGLDCESWCDILPDLMFAWGARFQAVPQ